MKKKKSVIKKKRKCEVAWEEDVERLSCGLCVCKSHKCKGCTCKNCNNYGEEYT